MPGNSEYNRRTMIQACPVVNRSEKITTVESCSNLSYSNSATSSDSEYSNSGSSSNSRKIVHQMDAERANVFYQEEKIFRSNALERPRITGKSMGFNKLLGGTISTLTTLNELARYILEYGNDDTSKDFSTSAENNMASKAPEDSECERRLIVTPGNVHTSVLNTNEMANSNSNSLFTNSVSSKLNKTGVTTSTPPKEREHSRILSFQDSAVLCDSQRVHEAEQIPEQQQRQTTYVWYGLPDPMFGTKIPNRIFVGGMSPQTTENELTLIFSIYGNVKATKIILDQSGVSKGYGFVTFETEEEASAICEGMRKKELVPMIHRERRLNIAPAVTKQQTRSQTRYLIAPSSQPSYTGVSYTSPRNAAQNHHRVVPIYQHFYPPYFNPQAFGSRSGVHPASAPIPTAGSIYGLSEQYVIYPSRNRIPCYVSTQYPPLPQCCANTPTFYHVPIHVECPSAAWLNPTPIYPN